MKSTYNATLVSKLKTKPTILATMILLSIVMMPITVHAVENPVVNKWGVIICGSWMSGWRETDRIYNLMDDYGFKDILYLSTQLAWPNTDGIATRQHVEEAFTEWLPLRVAPNDMVYVYFMGHGGGFCKFTYDGYLENTSVWGRSEISWDDDGTPAYSDEGNETLERWINPILPMSERDLNGDGDLDDWIGYDESFWLWDTQMVWDDELRDWMSNIPSCARTVISFTSCFSGGFLNDLSAPNRIIITSTNETWVTWKRFVNKTLYAESWFGYWFGVGLRPCPNPNTWLIDKDDNDLVSFKEAFDFAYTYDPKRFTRDESPWLSDNGNGVPAFIYGRDCLDCTDGDIASETHIGCEPYPAWDVNVDEQVDIVDLVIVALAWNASPGDDNWDPRVAIADPYDHVDIVDIVVVAIHYGWHWNGTHWLR